MLDQYNFKLPTFFEDFITSSVMRNNIPYNNVLRFNWLSKLYRYEMIGCRNREESHSYYLNLEHGLEHPIIIFSDFRIRYIEYLDRVFFYRGLNSVRLL